MGVEPVSHADRLLAVERQYMEMARDINAMQKAATRMEGSYRRLYRALDNESAGRERQAEKLEHYWRWTLLITGLGGFFGAILGAGVRRIVNDLISALQAW